MAQRASGAGSSVVKRGHIAFKRTGVHTLKGQRLWVRQSMPGDLEALVRMYDGFLPKRVAQGLPPPDVPRIHQWLEELQNKSRWLVASDGSRIAAHAIMCPISEAAVEFTIFVHQDWRQEGLGTILTRLSMSLAAEMGFREVFLTTELSNLPAVRLFRKAGFETRSSFGDECEMRLVLGQEQADQARAA